MNGLIHGHLHRQRSAIALKPNNRMGRYNWHVQSKDEKASFGNSIRREPVSVSMEKVCFITAGKVQEKLIHVLVSVSKINFLECQSLNFTTLLLELAMLRGSLGRKC